MLSIIIAFGKGKEYLKDCFDSIKEQDYKDIETVLVLDKANINPEENIEELINLINHIKELNRKNNVPMFIAIDQEGGRVNRLPNELENIPAPYKLSKLENAKEYVQKAGEITGNTLHRLGFNMNFAPVLDIKRFPDNHAIGDRAFSENIEEVTEYGIEYMKKLQENQIVSVVKHFPGHGATNSDSHFKIPKIKEKINEYSKKRDNKRR